MFDNLIWEVCLTKGFLFNEFTVSNAYVEHYLSEEEPDTKIFQSLYSSKLVTHRIVCLPRRGSEIEGAWGVNDNFSFEYFHNGLSGFESRKTRLPLDFFWCWINDELVCPKVADCHFFIEQIDPNRRFVGMGITSALSTEQLLNGYHEDSDLYSDSDDSDSDDSDSDDEI